MKAREDLHTLIHSLSQGEKWRFKVYSQRHFNSSEGKNYIRLFDAIDAQVEAYDEEAIRRQFAGETFVKQLSVTKNYLTKLILESLVAYQNEDAPEWEANRLMEQIELLYNKRMIPMALRLLKKVKNTAEEKDFTLLMLRALRVEKRLVGETKRGKQREKMLREIHQKEDELLSWYGTQLEYNRLSTEMNLLMVAYGRDKRYRKDYIAIMEHPAMRSAEWKRNPTTAYGYYVTMALCASMIGNIDMAYENTLRCLEVMEEHPDTVSATPIAYLGRYSGRLQDILSFSVELRRFDEVFERRLEDMKNIPQKIKGSDWFVEKAQQQFYMEYYCARLQQYTIQAEFAKGTALIPELEASLKGFLELRHPNPVFAPYICLGRFYFCSGSYDTALQWYREILNRSEVGSGHDIYGQVKIISLICHFESGHERVIEYEVKSLYRYLLKKKRPYKFEKLMLQFFQKELPKVRSGNSFREALKKLHAGFLKLQRDPYEHLLLSQFDILSWLESRIEGRPLPDMIREKAVNGVRSTP